MDSDNNGNSYTGALWFFATLALIALFIGSGMQGALTVWHVVLAFGIIGVVVAATPFTIRLDKERRDMPSAKAKRERIDNMLRDMSDEELLKLKQHLSSGEVNDEQILDYLSDDGELIFRR